MPEVKRFSHDSFLDNPIPYRRYRTARVANLPRNISEFSEGEVVDIEYFCTHRNEVMGGLEMPVYKVRKQGESKNPHLLFASLLADFR